MVRRPPPAPVEIPRNEKPFSTEVGVASWYGTSGRRAANGEAYDQDALTAASRTLPLGTIARVTNLATGQAVVVRITDRGPFVPGRILDLSLGAAKANGLYRFGVTKVRVEAFQSADVVLGPGRWCVQVGAFADPNDATQLKNDFLRRYGPTAKVITFKGDTGSWVRLTLAVPDRDKSEEAASQVRIPDPGVEAYVTRTN
ncbi:rare lipoprotein A [Granulicella pectinivorans]|uniref:Probable endolytic peptidoglycan transglycosylase RlpA n=1 Tax=Granulicella pectinivorans TaxID=474950 RepID=A0A1I6L1S2_9BACT|nr:septal ring lytic transglycosylase RlpA family protein [Granulicella pectinivorans]SFR97228.1 rare lipoprotein A [Granulicella pectinivorans]